MHHYHHHSHLPTNFNDAMDKLKIPYFKRKATAKRQIQEAKEEEEVAAFRKNLQEAQSLIFRNNPTITHEGRKIINPKYKGPNPYRGPGATDDEYLFNEAVHSLTWDPTPFGQRPSEYDDY